MKAHDFVKAFEGLPEGAAVVVSAGRLSILHDDRSFPILDISLREEEKSFAHKIERAVKGAIDWAVKAHVEQAYKELKGEAEPETVRSGTREATAEEAEEFKKYSGYEPLTLDKSEDPAPETA